VVAVVVAEVAIYAVGIPWLMAVAGLSFAAAFGAAVVPFLIPDAAKAALAYAVALGVRKATRA
jgi:biotin transport system substrate-specific component